MSSFFNFGDTEIISKHGFSKVNGSKIYMSVTKFSSSIKQVMKNLDENRYTITIFEGTETTGVPSKCLVGMSSTDPIDVRLRLKDITNNTLIAQNDIIAVAQQTSLYSLGTLSNLPIGEALFELTFQQISAGPAKSIEIASYILY